MGQPITWADGFGVWHVRVSKHAAGPLIAARGALRDELLARQDNVARSVWMHPIRVPDLDTEDTIVYREGNPEGPEKEPDSITVTITRSPGADNAVVVLIDTTFEPDGSDDGPGLRISVNDACLYRGKRYGRTGEPRPAPERTLSVPLSDLEYEQTPPTVSTTKGLKYVSREEDERLLRKHKN